MKGRYRLVCLILFLGGSVLIGWSLFYRSRTPSWGVVDMGVLMRGVSQDLAKTYPTGTVPPRDMEKTIERVKACLQHIAQEGNLILLPKGAVLGGSMKDYTPAVLQALEATP